MRFTLITLFAALAVLSSEVAYSDVAAVAGGAESGVGGRLDILLGDDRYEIQPDTSTMRFRVDSPIGDVWASFDDFTGRFTILDDAECDDFAAIEINANSLETNAGFIRSLLKGKRFFDVAHFPSMRFIGTSLEWYRDRHAVLKGYLTIKNVTRQVAFYVELRDADNQFTDRIIVDASTTIRRSEFGISSLLPAVSDDVNLFISINAVKQPTSLSMR